MDDAQFELAHVLRPIQGFETIYQGRNAVTTLAGPAIPVPFFDAAKFGPSYTGRDEKAAQGATGFDPNLLDYIPVPEGALMKLWIPTFTDPADFTNTQAYRYMIHWRLNDIVRYSQRLNTQYHLPKERPGAPDTTGGAPGAPRFVTPSATRAILINQVEATGAFTGQNTNVRREYLVVRGGEPPAQPRIPNIGGGSSEGVYQQGVIDPAVDPSFSVQSAFMEFEIVVGGDAFFLTVDRFGINGEASGADPWDFNDAGRDVGFSVIYGTGELSSFTHAPFNDVGVMVLWGKA